MTTKNHTVVAIFKSHIETEAALKELDKAGFDMKKVSIVAHADETDESVVGYYNTGDRMKYWGKIGAFWGWVLGFLYGSSLFFVPGFGALVVVGQLVGVTVGALEGSILVGGLSAIGAGLYSMGIAKDSVHKSEDALKAGKFVLVAQGAPEEASRAHEIISRTEPETLEHHR